MPSKMIFFLPHDNVWVYKEINYKLKWTGCKKHSYDIGGVLAKKLKNIDIKSPSMADASV